MSLPYPCPSFSEFSVSHHVISPWSCPRPCFLGIRCSGFLVIELFGLYLMMATAFKYFFYLIFKKYRKNDMQKDILRIFEGLLTYNSGRIQLTHSLW